MPKFPIKSVFLIICFSLALFLFINDEVKADPTEDSQLGDVVCSALLPCSPPDFRVFDGFDSGPCAKLYKTACDRWKEVKSKADALDIAAEKLTQCMQDKKKKKGAR
jgi:hypothetical protein